jgi:hypothetical protein
MIMIIFIIDFKGQAHAQILVLSTPNLAQQKFPFFYIVN